MNTRPERPKATRTYPAGGIRNRQTDLCSEAGTLKDDKLSKKSTTTKGTNESRRSKTNRSTVSGTISDGIGREKLTARVSKVFVPPIMVTNLVERKTGVFNPRAHVTSINNTRSPRGLPIGFVSRQEMEERVRQRRETPQAKKKPSNTNYSTARKGNSAASKGAMASKFKETDQRKDQNENDEVMTPKTISNPKTIVTDSIENNSPILSPEKTPRNDVTHKVRKNKMPLWTEKDNAESKQDNQSLEERGGEIRKRENDAKPVNDKGKHKYANNNGTIDESRSKSPNDSNRAPKRVTRSISAATKLSCQPQAPSISRMTTKTKPLSSVKVLIMNANGKDDNGGTPADRRKNVISNVIDKHMPHLVLFQEFKWTGISGRTWTKWPIPDTYVFKGHYDASIIYDNKSVSVSDVPATDIDNIIKGLQNNASNRLKRTFPMDFNPVSRMLMSHIVVQTKPALDFISVSWHGIYRKMTQLKRIEYFEYFIEFLRKVKEKYKLPMLVGGDFNIDMYTIQHLVKSPFKLCVYEASIRRTVKGIIDFYIVTEEIELGEITWINLEQDTTALNPNGVLDHDPVLAELKPVVDIGAGGLVQKKSGFSAKAAF